MVTTELDRQTSVEIQLNAPDDFKKIMETLTRVGVCSTEQSKEKVLYQTCHILHKKNRYWILHFKELLKLDGCLNDQITEQDISDRNFIAHFLEKCGLCKVLSEITPRETAGKIKIIKSIQKSEYMLQTKYTFSKRGEKLNA